jgi:hypothetical protein
MTARRARWSVVPSPKRGSRRRAGDRCSPVRTLRSPERRRPGRSARGGAAPRRGLRGRKLRPTAQRADREWPRPRAGPGSVSPGPRRLDPSTPGDNAAAPCTGPAGTHPKARCPPGPRRSRLASSSPDGPRSVRRTRRGRANLAPWSSRTAPWPPVTPHGRQVSGVYDARRSTDAEAIKAAGARGD